MLRNPTTLTRRFWAALRGDGRGNVIVPFAFLLPVFLAMTGLGFEGAHWYQTEQSMQNAADAAALAAATNATTSYDKEAKAVAAQYGFVNGANNVVVTTSNSAACPSGSNQCYSVAIKAPVRLIFAQLVGYTGDTKVGNAAAQLVTAQAVAIQGSAPRSYCLVGLASSGASQAIRTNGAPKADLTGCSVMSNTDAQCNGHDLKATYGDAAGTSSGCGATQTSKLKPITDPYAGLASNIPPDPCSSYAQIPAKKNGTPLPSSNKLSGTVNWGGNQTICGDLQLTGDVTLTGSDLVLVIQNGQLDTNGFTIKTASGAAATIVFSGDNSGSYTHAPTGGGTIDIAAPTSGAWSGVAMYQDPDLTSGVDVSAAGNSPTWDITGLVYLPHASVTFSGAVNKSSNGESCFVMVADNITINGTGSILSTGGCAKAGLNMPQSQVPSRGKLVA